MLTCTKGEIAANLNLHAFLEAKEGQLSLCRGSDLFSCLVVLCSLGSLAENQPRERLGAAGYWREAGDGNR